MFLAELKMSAGAIDFVRRHLVWIASCLLFVPQDDGDQFRYLALCVKREDVQPRYDIRYADVQLCSEFDGIARFPTDDRLGEGLRQAYDPVGHSVRFVPVHVVLMRAQPFNGIQSSLVRRAQGLAWRSGSKKCAKKFLT